MPSSYTLNNGIELIGTGEQSGTWGDTTNTNLELLDVALDGQVTITAASAGSSGSPNSLPISDGSASNGRNRLVNITSGTNLGSTVYYQLTPNDAEKIIYIRNSLNTQDLIVFQGTYNSSNDYVIPNGTTAVIFFNGAGAGAVAANVFNNAHFDNLNIVGDVTIGDDLTLNSDGAIINIGADNDLQITHSGSAGTITNATGDLTLDVAGDIVLDGDGASIRFKDNAVEYAHHYVNSNSYYIRSVISDADMIFQGNDGGSTFTALTLDMSAAGVAKFNVGGVFNESGADSDFRIESTNSTHMLFVDASEDAIGIRKSDPTYGLDVGVPMRVITADNSTQLTLESTDADASNGPLFDIYRNSASPANDDYTGRLRFRSRNNNSQDFTAVDFLTRTIDVADGSEDATLFINTMTGGTTYNRINITPTEIVLNEESRDVDFRVESDSVANMLFVDAGENRVNIGGTPNAYSSNRVNIYGDNVNPPGAVNGNLAVYAVDSQAAGNGGSISLGGRCTSSGSMYQFGAIQAVKKNSTSGNAAGLFKLYYVNSSNGTNPFLEASEDEIVFNNAGLDDDFRVESDTNTHALFVDAQYGNVGIKSTAPSYDLDINGAFRTTYSVPAYTSTTGTSSSANYWKIGRISNLAGSRTLKIRIQGTSSYSASGAIAGETTILFRGNNATTTIDGTFWSETMGNSHVAAVAWKQTGTGDEYDIYVNWASTFSGVDMFVESAGQWVLDVSDTGSESLPSGATAIGAVKNDFMGTTQVTTKSSSGLVVNEAASGAVDFRVESDSNTGAIYVDAANDRVGILSTGGENNFNVNAQGTSSHSTGTMPPGMTLYSNGSGDGTGNAIMFKNSTGAQGLSGIGSFRTGANGGYGRDLRFYTNNVVGTNAYKEKMRIAENGAIYGPQANYGGFITAEITQSHLGNDASGTADITYTLTLKNTSGTYDNWQVMMYLTTSGNSSPAKASVYEIRGSQRSSTATVGRTTLVSGETRTITSSVSGLVVTFTIASEGSSTATQGAKFCFVGGTYGCDSVAVGDSA